MRLPIKRCPLCGQYMFDGHISTINDEYVHFSMEVCPACYCELLADSLAPVNDQLRVVRELGIERCWLRVKGKLSKGTIFLDRNSAIC